MIHPSLCDDEGCVGCPCRGSEIRGRGPLVVRWSSQPCVCRVAATEFSRGFQPTDRVAPHIGSRRVATDERHPSGIHAGGTPALPGFPVAIPFTSQGLYSTVADATGGWGSPMIRGLKPIVGEPTIRGLKPTAKFICRYAAKIRYPKIRIVVCGQSRHRRVEILPRRVATADFCRGFQPTDHVAPIGSRRVSDG